MSRPTVFALPLLSTGAALAYTLWACAAWAQAPDQTYRLGAGDQVSVTVVEAPELNTNQVVDNAGVLTLPRDAGRVSVVGLTVVQAEAAVKERLERELRTATVDIAVEGTRSSSVRLLGAVNTPGPRTIGTATGLFELLTRSDVIKSPNAGIVKVRRTSSHGFSEQVEIPLAPLLQGLEPRYNLPLLNGDLITVPEGEQITVYFATELSGSVTLEVGEPKTLIRAISKAGGLTERSSGKIIIARTLADGTIKQIEANYKRILNSREPDVLLQNGDLINVKRSIF